MGGVLATLLFDIPKHSAFYIRLIYAYIVHMLAQRNFLRWTRYTLISLLEYHGMADIFLIIDL